MPCCRVVFVPCGFGYSATGCLTSLSSSPATREARSENPRAHNPKPLAPIVPSHQVQSPKALFDLKAGLLLLVFLLLLPVACWHGGPAETAGQRYCKNLIKQPGCSEFTQE